MSLNSSDQSKQGSLNWATLEQHIIWQGSIFWFSKLIFGLKKVWICLAEIYNSGMEIKIFYDMEKIDIFFFNVGLENIKFFGGYRPL